jgi:AraC family transcriptional regulator, transcriptional activator of pobA
LISPELVRFSRFKYGRELRVDASLRPAWTGIVADSRAHTLDFHELLLIESGGAAIALDGHRSHVHGPAIVLTRPHQIRCVEVRDPMRLRLVVFPDDAVQRCGAAPALARLPQGISALRTDEEFRRLCDLADSLAGELVHQFDDSPIMLEALLSQLIVQIGRRVAPPAGVRRRPALLVGLERLVESRFRDEHRASAYAALLGVTPDHLSAVVRAHQGGSVKRVIHERVMREAVHLLLTTDARIADIAARLGYHDTAHFVRAFTRRAGMAPGQYRRRH